MCQRGWNDTADLIVLKLCVNESYLYVSLKKKHHTLSVRMDLSKYLQLLFHYPNTSKDISYIGHNFYHNQLIGTPVAWSS